MTKDLKPATLHAALDTFAEDSGTVARRRISPSIRNRRRGIVERLKLFHEDIPLAQLDLDACIVMIEKWKDRPVSARTGRPFAASSAKATLSQLIQFLGWLDTSEQFAWKSPSHLGQVSRRVRRLPGDRTRRKADSF